MSQASLREPLNGNNMSFVHLHVHSHYSLLQASCTIPSLIDKCVEFKMPAMALTDYGNMFGALEFYFEARKKNIKPILASEVYYVEDYREKENFKGENFRDPTKGCKTLILLATNLEAYRNLCCISTISYQKGFYFVPRADYALLDKYKEGLIALTGAGRGRLPWLFHTKGESEAVKEIKVLKNIFGSQLYLELQPVGIPRCEDYNLFLASVGEDFKIPLVAGGDVHYTEKKDSVIQDVLFCIGTNRTLYDKDRARLSSYEFYLKSPEEMRSLFKDHPSISTFYPEACDNTSEIAERCSVFFKIKDAKGRPVYHLPQVVKKKDSLKNLAQRGLQTRIKEALLKGEEFSLKKKEEYLKRIQYELEIIDRMGFNGYFYIVYDFINWAKNQSIPVGPGRGSGASSLVSYCLGITDIDPMPLGLIFERFLNPDRISMPDFDIDFCQESRQRVIDYITEKYGSDCSSHVITYGRLSVRAAIRDVGRVLALSYNEVDQVAKLIPEVLGITLKEALKKEPRLQAMSEEDPKIKELIELTGLLEGLIRHVGIHAAGIIIADHPIINYAPLYRGLEGENVIQYDLKYAEKIGLVKFDFLGLKTLTHIAEALRLIKEHRGQDITTQQISLKDSGIYEIMSRGDTGGIFQFESSGITDLLIKSQPTCFEDIIAINALYRPGPMNMIPSYLDRKKARVPVKYIFPELERILKETYGIIVYQEQVQQIAVEIAGYSYGEADVLRRAMGKKIRSVMAKQKNRFLEGAKQKKYDLKKAEQLFDLMAEFAKYGFNKSHAAAYCVLAAQTAWLKNYYPIEFFVSQMSIEQNDTDKLMKCIRDARRCGFLILSPHINTSFDKFTILQNQICFSFGAIKGVGQLAAKEIVRARESLKEKKFSRVEEFFEVVDLKKINKKTLESLVKSGSFDGLGYERKDIFNNMEKFYRYAEKRKEDQKSGQQSLFSLSLDEEDRINIVKKGFWVRKEKLNFEKEVFGFYLNDHPMKVIEGLEKSLSCQPLLQLEERLEEIKNNGDIVDTLGVVSDIREVVTKKKGQLMAFAFLEGGYSSVKLIFFPEIYEKARKILFQTGSVFYIKGRPQKVFNSSQQLVVEDICFLDDFLKSIQTVKLDIYPDMRKKDLLNLKQILSSSKKGDSSVSLQVYMPSEKAFVEMETQRNIEINHDFLQKVRTIIKNAEHIHLY